MSDTADLPVEEGVLRPLPFFVPESVILSFRDDGLQAEKNRQIRKQ